MSVSTTQSFVLLPHIIEQNAQSDPSGVFAQIPVGIKYTDGYKDVSKIQFANAVDHTAFLIKQNLGHSDNFETLTYIGPQDLRYSIVVVAGIKAGYKVFLPSPRNSKEAHVSLLDKLECTKLVMTDPHAPCIPTILGVTDLQTMTLPSLKYLLEVAEVEDYPFVKSFAEAKSEPAFVLHTSGSTGIPKHLTFTHEFISRLIMACSLPPPEAHVDISRYFSVGKFFITLPSFHIAGLAYSLLISVYLGGTPVYTLPGPPPTTESFISAISNADIDWAFVPPVVIDELGKRPDLLSVAASRLKYLFFTGGSLPKASGDVVARQLPIWQVLGSSECASFPLIHAEAGYRNSEDWNYVQLNPRVNSEMRHRFDDLHELVVLRSAETEAFQPVFAHFPDTTEYATRDLFKSHPSKPGLWAHQSRIDDVIVFLNGEKTNPVTFEDEVISHPDIRFALVVGSERLEAALLIELTADMPISKEEKATVVDRIWPVIENANKATPAHARISRNNILLVSPNKPMQRAGKGTVMRKATLALYAEEIEELYRQNDDVGISETRHAIQYDVKTTIRDLIAEMLGLDDMDFFQSGMDSLGVLKLQRSLRAQFPKTKVSLNTIYSHSSVNALAQALSKSSATNGETLADKELSTKELAKMLKEFTKKIDATSPVTDLESPASSKKHTTILLTGSTGALGSYMLNLLLSMPNVAHIYCFNRSSDAKDRQIKNNQARGLDIDFPPERVTFLTGDLIKHNWGLPGSRYQDLLLEVTHIIHNAWPVNFNLPLSAFHASLSGVISLIHFSRLSRCNIQFISSISSVSSYQGSTVPEAVVTELSAPAAMGYGQSKYLAERLLDHASTSLGVKASIIRIGQVAGAARTASGWNRQEWFPSLVTSSAFIGVIPETLGDATADGETINWVPMDQLADVVIQLALNANASHDVAEHCMVVFHIVHPKPVPWSSLLIPIKKALESLSPQVSGPKVVSYTDWISTLKDKSIEIEKAGNIHAADFARMNPALKLLNFYEDLQHQGSRGLRTKMSMENTLKSSKTLRELEALKDEWITGWVKEWIDI